VQSDEIKQQVVEQNALPSIIQYTKETSDNPAPLEVAYALAFNLAAKIALNEDKEFIDHVEKMKDSDNKEVANAAHGVLWKLKEEDKFMKEADENKANKEADENNSNKEADENKSKDKEAEESKSKNKEPEEGKSKKEEAEESKSDKEPTKETKESKDDKEKPEQYDMMISYCWAQKELCHKINDRLEKDGYSVWLDRDEMRGSIVESMAEAVENSKVVLVCMSSNYKASTNCQAEAEYAFNRKSKIIPLMVEKDYKPDGWLGFMAGSKLYVDFADKEDEEFDKAYELLIAEIKRQEVDENAEDEKAKATSDASTSKEPEPTPEEPEPVPVQTRAYLGAGPVTMWTDVHVNEFLTDHELDPLVSVCKSMDGETLLEFYQASQATPSAMLPLINKGIEGTPVSINTFFKFIVKLKQFLPPPKPLPKVYFRYNLIYGPATTDDKSTNGNDA
jgi:cell division septation protein DedD